MTSGKIEGLAPGTISWTATSESTGGVIALAVEGGVGGNTFTVDDTGDFFDGTSLVSGTGSSSFNFVNVEATSAPPSGSVNALTGSIAIDGGDDGQWVTIGNNGSLAGIKGAVQIFNSGNGYSYLNANDSADAKARSATFSDGTLTGLSNQGPITGTTAPPVPTPVAWSTCRSKAASPTIPSSCKAPATFTRPPDSQSTTQLLLGDGNNVVNVQATTGSLGVDEGQNATVNVGSDEQHAQ